MEENPYKPSGERSNGWSPPSLVAKQLPYLPIIVLVTLNVWPARMVSSGTQHWFAQSVPEPERFTSTMHDAPPAVRVFGYPFVCYLKHGREFTTKEGWKLFWPSQERRSITGFRFLSFIGDLALAGGSGVLLKLLLLLVERHGSRAALPRTISGC